MASTTHPINLRDNGPNYFPRQPALILDSPFPKKPFLRSNLDLHWWYLRPFLPILLIVTCEKGPFCNNLKGSSAVATCGQSKHWHLFNKLILHHLFPKIYTIKFSYFSWFCSCCRKLLFWSLRKRSLIFLYPGKNVMYEMGESNVGGEKKSSTEEQNIQIFILVKILSNKSSIFFNQTQKELAFCLPQASQASLLPILHCPRTTKYHWGCIPNNLIL